MSEHKNFWVLKNGSEYGVFAKSKTNAIKQFRKVHGFTVYRNQLIIAF